ncbi:MAG: malonyl CoA-acyl carrier protein transacylase, partial [Alphaproteobacteria bacterium]|nr:malonyl CoA-acyl carrier protein transacylase [Alphaproteobacteria bacterium]
FDYVSAEAIQVRASLTQLLIDQVTGRVRWRESIEMMLEAGVTATLEIGAGKVLTGLSKRIHPSLEGIALNTPYDIESLLKQDIAA